MQNIEAYIDEKITTRLSVTEWWQRSPKQRQRKEFLRGQKP